MSLRAAASVSARKPKPSSLAPPAACRSRSTSTGRRLRAWPKRRGLDEARSPAAAASAARRRRPRPARASSASRRCERRLRGGPNGSITAAPAIVRVADGSRRMTRSPASAPILSSSTSCASAVSPGASLSPSSSATRPMTWAEPRWTCTGDQCLSGWPSEASRCRRTSSRSVGACSSGLTTQSPRRIGILRKPRPGEVERAALAGAADLGRAVLRMQRAHARLQPRRRQQQPVVDPDLAGMDGAGDDDACARQHEAAIDREPREARGALAAFAQRQQLGLELVDALSGQRRDRHDLRALERGRGEQRLDLGHALEDLVVVGEVGLGQRHDAAIEAQQVDDLQMLDRLRLDALGRRHDQQRGIDAGGAGQHVVHEALVARHVDEAELPAVAQVAVGVAEIDGDAARLLFLQAIGVDAGQRFDQRGLAVVDMACGADDHAAPSSSSCATNAASSSRVRRSK